MKDIRPFYVKVFSLFCKLFGHKWTYYPPGLGGDFYECDRCWKDK